MKLLVISSSPFIKKGNDYFAYSPYAKELAIWAKYADEIAVTCPIWKQDNGLLISEISFPMVMTLPKRLFLFSVSSALAVV